MTRPYRAGLVLLACCALLLSLSIVQVEAGPKIARVSTQVFNSTIWAVLFAIAAAPLLFGAVTDRPRAVMAGLLAFLAIYSGYAFTAWLIVFDQGLGWQAAARVSALAVCHGLLIVCGPDLAHRSSSPAAHRV